MGKVLFDNGEHRCVAFTNLVPGGDGVQANQFLIIDSGKGALIDPGGDLLYMPLWLGISSHLPPSDLRWLFASHQDPDIIGAAGRWLANTPAQLVCSKLWGRFVPHNISSTQTHKLGDDRYVLLPDKGGFLPLGRSEIVALPAHFLHSVGNFSFFDPVSRILFSGDIGSSLLEGGQACQTISRFDTLIPLMEGFHRRYMASNRATKRWASMVRALNPAMIVPQHGHRIGSPAIAEFLSWLEQLECGVDLLDETHYQYPSRSYF